VHHHRAARVVDAHRHHVVEAPAPRVDRQDERPPLAQLVTQDDHVAGKDDRRHPPLAREVGEPRAADSPQLRVDERPRDRVVRGLLAPVAQDHRERRRAARVLLLGNEGHRQLERRGEKGRNQHSLRMFKGRAAGRPTSSH
jgi:hypothetical protein